MRFEKTVILKDGRVCRMVNAGPDDAERVKEVFVRCHSETDYLLTYPDESGFSVEEERVFLAKKEASAREIEIIAIVDGNVVGSAGISCVGEKEKIRHRAEFGISVLRDYWRLGIGRALTDACVECAKQAGYSQLELDVVSDNSAAIALYRASGFREYGRNPRGFRSRAAGWQELVLMRMEL